MNFSENRPIYIQISDYFTDQVLSGKWKPGDRIPSVREVAVQMEVNPNTAIRAFHTLQEEGVLYNQRGVGYFIDEQAVSIVKKKRRNEFINQKLPLLFKEMELLEFSFQELEEIYNKE